MESCNNQKDTSLNIPENDAETISYSGSESSASETSSGSMDAEWENHVHKDGSLVFVESYVSSTVKEKQDSQVGKSVTGQDKNVLFSSPAKSIKHHTKLLNLLKRRPSVRGKSQRFSANDATRSTPANISTDLSPPKVTFRDNPSGEVRRILLMVTEAGNTYGRRASLCEVILGIMPGRFSEPHDSRVMVAGLVPGSQALKDGVIKIGDWLKELDDREVVWENLNEILLAIQVPSTVTLVVQKCASETLPQEDLVEERIIQTQLAKLITGSASSRLEWNLRAQKGEIPLHVVLYLSLEGVTETSQDKDDIKYQFPSYTSKLVLVRGMFITAAHSVQETVGSPLLSCSIVLEGEYYNVALIKADDDVLLLILPNSFASKLEIIDLLDHISKLVIFEYGTLANAFCNDSDKSHLDHIFSMFFEDIFFDERLKLYSENTSLFELISSRCSRLFPGPFHLLLKDEVAKIQLETCLTELESGDFGEDEDCEDCQLQYNIIGCSIFYKGYLAMSHLDQETLRDVFLFLHYHQLLQLTRKEAVSQLIVWRRVYCPLDEPTSSASEELRHYILIIGMNHMLLAMILESGNVTELLDEKVGPDPFLVDQAETTLYHLHSIHVHTACEESVLHGTFEIVCLDDKLKPKPLQKKSKKPNLVEDNSTVRTPDVQSILKQKSQVDTPLPYYQCACEFPSCDCKNLGGKVSEDLPPPCNLPEEVDDCECLSDDKETSSSSDFRLWKGSETSCAYCPESQAVVSKGDPPPPIRITVGKDNVLFHFLQLDSNDGVLVTSANSFPDSSEVVLHAELIQNFYWAVSHIKHILHAGARSKALKSCSNSSNVLNNIKEHGIMFECSNNIPQAIGSTKKKHPRLSYWVIGRLYGPPYDREIYVAIDDSIPQNIHEIAFKLSLRCS